MEFYDECGIDETETATAMATKTLIEWLFDVFVDKQGMYSTVGRKLTEISKNLGLDIKDTPHSNYGTVHAYHAEAIAEFRSLLQHNLEWLKKYRRNNTVNLNKN